jgi:O-antigen/teichoic acid export membrane protein
VSTDDGGLGRRSITAMLWGTGGSVLRIAMQIASQIVLARILGPELYGVFAVAVVAVMLSSLLADVGLAYGLIQKRSVSSEDIRFIFTWQVLLGCAMMIAIWLASPYIASLYGDARVGPVLAMLAPSCLINAAAAASGALLRREMNFKSINIAAVTSYALGFLVVAIPLAMAGTGVMALVAGVLVQTAVMALMQYGATRHPVEPLIWHSGAPGILAFGTTVLSTNLVNWVLGSVDRAIVGATLGLSAAGVYATASNLVSAPLLSALSLLQSVFYSASSKVQDDRAQLARGLTTMLGTVTLFAAPVFVGVAIAAESIFLTLYGHQWAGGGAVLAPLALAMPAYLLMGLSTPVLWASGQIRKELELQAPIAVIWVGGLWFVAGAGSLPLLAWSMLVLFLFRACVIVRATLKAVDLPVTALLMACRTGLAVTAIVGICALAADRLFASALPPGPARLAIDIAVCAIAMIGGLRAMCGSIDTDIRQLLDRLAERVPGTSGRRLLAAVIGDR